jgi:hypothetical protein
MESLRQENGFWQGGDPSKSGFSITNSDLAGDPSRFDWMPLHVAKPGIRDAEAFAFAEQHS